MESKKIEELQRLKKEGIITQEDFEEQKKIFLQNYLKSAESPKENIFFINYKYVVTLLVCIGFICGSIVYGKKITKDVINYVTPFIWQITASYKGESVCLMYMQDKDAIDNKDNMINDIEKARQTCKCLHNIAQKNGVSDFRDFIRAISENGKLYKEWMHKTIDGEQTSVENSYIKTWIEFWLKDTLTDCE